MLGAVRKPDARAVPGTSSDNRRRDEDEISRAKGEWNASCLNGSRFLELFWNRYQQERQTALWSGRVAESRRVVAEQLSEVAGIMDRAACDLYSLNSLPDELSEKSAAR